MSARLRWLAIAALLISGCSPETDLSRIQGKWDSITVTNRGKEVDPRGGGFEFAEHRVYNLRDGSRSGADGVFKLNTAKDPKWFDMHLEQDKPKVRGIYELKGDELRICLIDDAESLDDRPREFSSEPDDRSVLLKMKRRK